jgi:hypothetical protein
MRRIVYILMCLLLSPWIGCDTKPFEVLAPILTKEVGHALVSVQVPSFSRGLIQRVRIGVTTADTSRLRPITREMNFPIPGGNLAVGEVADIPVGKRRFTVTAFDTEEVLRFRGFTDSVITSGRTQLVQVGLDRIGGTVRFQTVIDLAEMDTSRIDSTGLAALPLTSMLDILELIPQAHHPQVAALPLVSVGLGDRFSTIDGGVFSRTVTVAQIPTGTRRFVAHVRDLSSNLTRAFADTATAEVDTSSGVDVVFSMKEVVRLEDLLEVFTKTTLPRDSTVVVVTPQF